MVVRAEFETFPAKAGRSPRVNLVLNDFSFVVSVGVTTNLLRLAEE